MPDLASSARWSTAMHGSDSQRWTTCSKCCWSPAASTCSTAMRMLIPPAWQNVETMDPICARSTSTTSMHMEPWDGPAGVVLTDGRYAACTLDRNGLRPARWVTTTNGITLASEIGVWDYQPEDVIAKGKLGPGQMLARRPETGADPARHRRDRRPLKSRTRTSSGCAGRAHTWRPWTDRPGFGRAVLRRSTSSSST
ncbi:MAG: hypothetical protein LKM38_26555 [Pseudomonas veronii]|jgi:hypothetical protein|nr:hypothetical protein [Pseudomonas veronii]